MIMGVPPVGDVMPDLKPTALAGSRASAAAREFVIVG
jgi:hypothetical protein